jgi:UDP-glucuronate decarboxylase
MLLPSWVVVFGGTGFIGNHLCRKLLSAGYRVICVDNNYSGSTDNIRDMVSNHNFRFIRHDIIEPIKCIDEKVSHIFHLACPASPKAYQRDPLFTINTCVIGTINVLEFALKTGAKVLFTSTSEVYGDPMVSPQPEEYWGHVNPVGVRSCYDEGKRMAETTMMEYKKKYDDLQVCVARIFNTYGPNMDKDDGRVVSNFIMQCLENKDITIYGTGLQTRSFCYVDDTVEGLIRLMNGTTTGPINIGNPHEITVSELATTIVSMVPGTKSQIVRCELPSDDPTRRCPDITKAQTLLGWSPKVVLREGLQKTIAYFTEKARLERKD